MRKKYAQTTLVTLALLTTASFAKAADNLQQQEQSQQRPLPSLPEQQNTHQPASTIMTMGEIMVTGEQAPVAVDLPGSIDVVGEEEIARQNNKTALDALRNVPGITIGDYNSGGVPNGFTLRGFGNGSHGNHTAVTIDGIPYNYHMGSADGAIDLNQLIADDIIGIEVVKGPIDARYANWNRAGAIHFHTRNTGDFSRIKAEYGSFNTRKASASLGSEHLDGKFNQVYSVEFFDTDGYQDNSAYDRQNFYGKWFYQFTESLRTGLVLHTYDADWHTAGYLPEYLWTQNPKQSIQEDDGGWKDLSEAQLHLDWDINESMPLEVKAWVVDEDYSRWADWGGGQTESHYEHRILGALANLGYDIAPSDTSLLRIDSGFDWRSFSTVEQKFDTTYRHRTGLISDYDYDLNNFGLYSKVNYDPFAALRLFAGGRYDMFSGESTDNQSNTVMDMRDYDIWTASAGAIYSFLEHYSLYANTGTGFQLPQGSDKYQINAPHESDLLHWEIGTKAEWEHILLRYAYFHSDEDTIRWIAGEYINEGDTERNGHELEISLSPLPGLQLFSSWTYHEATYQGGENQGKEVPSIPEYILKIGGEYRFTQGTSLSLWYRDTGSWYTTADNLYSYPGYEVVDMRLAQEIGTEWELALNIKNLLDEEYSEYVGYWSDPYGVPDNQYAGSDGRYIGLSLSWHHAGEK